MDKDNANQRSSGSDSGRSVNGDDGSFFSKNRPGCRGHYLFQAPLWGWVFDNPHGPYPSHSASLVLAIIALEKLPAATFGTLAYSEPIVVVTLGWMLFGETLSALQLTGCLFIIVSGAVKGYLTAQAGPA